MKRFLDRKLAGLFDLGMCSFMNVVQLRHRLVPDAVEQFERYVTDCETLTPEGFYALPEAVPEVVHQEHSLRWPSPVSSGFRENDQVHVDFFEIPGAPGAPTVLILHALMSASDLGYRKAARRFNELGWNACFVHLPYHYSRRPRGFLSGEQAITADLVRTGNTLRQGVIELRQLQAWLRARGCREFGLLATSYGGWLAALLTAVEKDFRFVALMAPIVNVRHAVWESGAAVLLRRHLNGRGIGAGIIERHAHLSSPLHQIPLCGGERVILAAGTYDRIARAADIEELHRRWSGSTYFTVPQGHFGYRMLPATLRRLMRRGLLETS